MKNILLYLSFPLSSVVIVLETHYGVAEGILLELAIMVLIDTLGLLVKVSL